MAYPGPTANLKARHRRSGRAGTVWNAGKMLGEVTAIEWDTEIEQVPVTIPGRWQDGTKPGGEARRGTFRHQDIHDKWARIVWRFLKARREGDRKVAAEFPVFDLIVQIDDVGAPAKTRWLLRDCQLYSYGKGFSSEEQLLVRDVPFTFEDDEPLDSFEYTDAGVVTY